MYQCMPLMHHYLLVVIEPTTDLSNAVWRCPKQHYFCNDYDHGCAHTSYYICDGQYNCESRDEKYCDQTVSQLKIIIVDNNIFVL